MSTRKLYLTLFICLFIFQFIEQIIRTITKMEFCMTKINNYSQLIQYLKNENLTIATAESCTGGLIAKLITDISGSSDVFPGGVVSYSNKMKQKWLHVNEETLVNYGAVSQETVAEMLDGIKSETGADIAVAISGVAGPGGGTIEKPVGTVYIGILSNGNKIIKRYIFQGSREDVRNNSAIKILELIQEIANS